MFKKQNCTVSESSRNWMLVITTKLANLAIQWEL